LPISSRLLARRSRPMTTNGERLALLLRQANWWRHAAARLCLRKHSPMLPESLVRKMVDKYLEQASELEAHANDYAAQLERGK
jgi:hypothetical protein